MRKLFDRTKASDENWEELEGFDDGADEEYYEELDDGADEEYYEELDDGADEEYYEELDDGADEEYYEESDDGADEEYYEELDDGADGEYYEESDDGADEEYYEESDDGADGEYYEESDDGADEEYYEELDDDAPDGGAAEKERAGLKAGCISLLKSLEKADWGIVGLGAAILLLMLGLGGVYIRQKTVEGRASELASVGLQLDGIEVIGERGLLAVADAATARIEAAELLEQQRKEEEERLNQQKEYEENEYSQNVTVVLKTVSVQKDLKIKFVNKGTDKLISNTPFSVTVTTPEKKEETWLDDDMDGIIYKKNISAGEYRVTVNELPGDYAGYTLPANVYKVQVKKDIDYKKIDVSDEVKKESQVNVATEEQKKKEPVEESSLKDTVKWVESTSGQESYVEVARSDVVDPAVLSVSSGDAEPSDITPEKLRENTVSALRDIDGNVLYLPENSSYRMAVYADYYRDDCVFYKKSSGKLTGWQTIDGVVYYYDESGRKVTGEQVIQGAKYNFASDGSLVKSSGVMGIDVSKHNGDIDWKAVKNSGVSYVIIRCGYRGYTQGAIIEDSSFAKNAAGASAAGLNVGVYFFSQAVDEVEAVAEASFVLDAVSGYKISYPIFLDVEYSGSAGNKGRADGLDKASRTAVCKAFCATIQSGGYTAGIYANKTWLETKIDVGQLGAYKIWLAQYVAEPTYAGRYDLWQYKCTGQVSGISGKVDLNISYLGY